MGVHGCCCRLVCQPPELDLSNRVLREFAAFRDRFVRLSFGDERGEQLYLTGTTTPADADTYSGSQSLKRASSNAGMSSNGGRKGRRQGRDRGRQEDEYVTPVIGEPWTHIQIESRWH
jgi:hypothetical protein